jgi:hypothetical protein
LYEVEQQLAENRNHGLLQENLVQKSWNFIILSVFLDITFDGFDIILPVI